MADAIARGACSEPRNSGVILSQLLRGLADVLRQADEPSGDTVAWPWVELPIWRTRR